MPNSPEEIALDIQHFDSLITETEAKLAKLRQHRDQLQDADTIYRRTRGTDRQAA